jgi:hypothetical protein
MFVDDELRARAYSVAAPATCPVVLRARIGRCRSPAGSPFRSTSRGERGESSRRSDRLGRASRLLRGRDRRGRRASLRWSGRATLEQLELFAQSLAPTDRVALQTAPQRAERRDACLARACASRLCPRSRSCCGRRPSVSRSRGHARVSPELSTREPSGRTHARSSSKAGA